MGCICAKSPKKVCHDGNSAMNGNQEAVILPVFRLDSQVISTNSSSNCNNKAASNGSSNSENEKNAKMSSNGPATEPKRGLKVKAVGPSKVHGKLDPKVTGKYDFKKSIGKGRYSRVLLVENRLTKQPYAMKIAIGQEGKEIYQSELSILSRIRHPHVIQLIETFETSERFYMVLQLATGGDLFDRVVSQPRGHFGEGEAARILAMVLDGVQYLHRLGITHRDLKPDNLLFYHPGHDSNILITDFVIANMRTSGGNDFMRTGCGTPEYIAPEVLARKPYTSAVDLWALGVVAYIVLSGSFPFVDDPTSNRPNIKLYKLILKGAYSYQDKVWEGVSSIAKDFISKLLVVDPEKRTSAAEALEHPWIREHAVTGAADEQQRNRQKTSLSSGSDDSSSSLTSATSPLSEQPRSKREASRDPELSILKECILAHHSPFVSS